MDEQTSHNWVEDQIRSECPTSVWFRWTVWQTGVFDTSTLFELRLEQPGVNSAAAPKTVPPGLRAIGASQAQWESWVGLVEAEQRAHCLHSCGPYCRMAYSFFPLGGFQPCLCACNPITCVEMVRVRNARGKCIDAINADLALLDPPGGAHFRFTQRAAVFARGPLPPGVRKEKRGGFTQIISVAMSQQAGLPFASRIERRAEEEEEAQVAASPVRV